MAKIPNKSLFGAIGFKGQTEEKGDLADGYNTELELTGMVIEKFGSVISSACRLQMIQTGCSYEEAAASFLLRCDEACTVSFLLDLPKPEEKSTKKK